MSVAPLSLTAVQQQAKSTGITPEHWTFLGKNYESSDYFQTIFQAGTLAAALKGFLQGGDDEQTLEHFPSFPKVEQLQTQLGQELLTELFDKTLRTSPRWSIYVSRMKAMWPDQMEAGWIQEYHTRFLARKREIESYNRADEIEKLTKEVEKMSWSDALKHMDDKNELYMTDVVPWVIVRRVNKEFMAQTTQKRVTSQFIKTKCSISEKKFGLRVDVWFEEAREILESHERYLDILVAQHRAIGYREECFPVSRDIPCFEAYRNEVAASEKISQHLLDDLNSKVSNAKILETHPTFPQLEHLSPKMGSDLIEAFVKRLLKNEEGSFELWQRGQKIWPPPPEKLGWIQEKFQEIKEYFPQNLRKLQSMKEKLKSEAKGQESWKYGFEVMAQLTEINDKKERRKKIGEVFEAVKELAKEKNVSDQSLLLLIARHRLARYVSFP